VFFFVFLTVETRCTRLDWDLFLIVETRCSRLEWCFVFDRRDAMLASRMGFFYQRREHRVFTDDFPFIRDASIASLPVVIYFFCPRRKHRVSTRLYRIKITTSGFLFLNRHLQGNRVDLPVVWVP
jgi:hypothetical protein